MLNVNDGEGLYTTSGLIDSIMIELEEIECKGIDNHAHIISCMQKLASVRKVVKESNIDERRIEIRASEDESGS